MEVVKITIEEPDNLVRHIEGLQAVITKRNQRIEQLEAALSEYKDGIAWQTEGQKRAVHSAYMRGFDEARTRITDKLIDTRNEIYIMTPYEETQDQ